MKRFTIVKRYTIVKRSAIVCAILAPHAAQACSVCFGDPESPTAHALRAAIFTLLGVTVFMLAGIGGFAYRIWKYSPSDGLTTNGQGDRPTHG